MSALERRIAKLEATLAASGCTCPRDPSTGRRFAVVVGRDMPLREAEALEAQAQQQFDSCPASHASSDDATVVLVRSVLRDH